MITKTYNPSTLETEFASALKDLEGEISARLSGNTLLETKIRTDRDNPDLLFVLEDSDRDRHEIVVKIIQRNDEDLKK